MVGICGYGSALPVNRVKAMDILDVWKNTTPEVLISTGQGERCVTRPDEDNITLALDAANRALKSANTDPSEIDAIIFGSGTNPYATKATAAVLQDALGIPSSAFATDVQFSAKSGTSAMRIAYSLIKSGEARKALVVAADTLNLHIPPGHYYEYSASAGATSFVLGTESVIAEIEGFSSYSSDRSEWFRLDGDRYLQTGGGFIGYRANWGLLEHAIPAAKSLMGKLRLEPDDFNHAALHQGTMVHLGMLMGVLKLNPGIVMRWALTRQVGDLGAAGPLMAYANILDQVNPNERTLVVSWGWGSGSDALSLKTTEELVNHRSKPSVRELIANKQYVSYAMSLKYEGKVMRSMTDSHAYL